MAAEPTMATGPSTEEQGLLIYYMNTEHKFPLLT